MTFKSKNERGSYNGNNLLNDEKKSKVFALKIEAEEILQNRCARIEEKVRAIGIIKKNNITESAPVLANIVFSTPIQVDVYLAAFNVLASWLRKEEESVADAIIKELHFRVAPHTLEVFFDLVDYAKVLFGKKLINCIGDYHFSYFARTLFVDFLYTLDKDYQLSLSVHQLDSAVESITSNSSIILKGLSVMIPNKNFSDKDEFSIEDEIEGSSSLLLRILSYFNLSPESEERINNFAIELIAMGYPQEAILLAEKTQSISSLLVFDAAKQKLKEKIEKGEYSSLKERKELEETLAKLEAEIRKRGVASNFININHLN